MSDRPILDPARRTEAVAATIAAFHSDILDEVRAAVDRDEAVIVGMAWNTAVKRAKAQLDARGVKYTYLEYGNYTNMWRHRLAIKMWSGWPTFPQVFVKGVLVGGSSDLKKAVDDGTLDRLLAKAA